MIFNSAQIDWMDSLSLNSRIIGYAEVSDGEIWVGSRNGQVYSINFLDQQVEQVAEIENNCGSLQLIDIEEKELILSCSSFIYFLLRNKKEPHNGAFFNKCTNHNNTIVCLDWFQLDTYFSIFDGKEVTRSQIDGLQDETEINIKKFGNDLYLVTSQNVYLLDDSLKIQKKLQSGAFFTNVYKDLESGMWFTSIGKGIFHVKNHPIFPISLEDDKINFLKKGKELIVGQSNRFYTIDAKHNIKQEEVSKDATNYGKYLTLYDYHSSNDSIWIFTNVGIFVNGKLISDNDVSKSMVFWNEIKTVSGTRGIYQLEKIVKNKKGYYAFSYTYLLQGITTTEVFHDSIFIAYTNGLQLLTSEDTLDVKEIYPDLDVRILDLAIEDSGNLWMASDGKGVYFLNKNGLLKYDESGGLPSNLATCLLLDKDLLWVGTRKGLAKISLENGSIAKVDVSDGLSSNNIVDIEEMNGNIYVATDKGLSFFDRATVFNNGELMSLDFTNISVDNIVYDNRQSKFDFKPGSKNVTIDYLGLSYASLGNIEYEYSLKTISGEQEKWIKTKNTTFSLWNIQPDTYEFKVRGRPSNGVWSKPIFLEFTINPFFYESKLFLWGTIFSLITLMVMLFFYLHKRAKRRNELKNKLATYQLKTLKAQINPHFLFNVLNSIQGFIVNNDNEEAEKYLSRFSILMRKTLEHSDKTYISVQEELENLNTYIKLEQVRTNFSFKFELEVHDDIDPYSTYVPAMVLQPYVENSIWHGLNPMSQGGLLKVSIKQEQEKLLIEIYDNGVGIDTNKKEKPPHKSAGTKLINERMELLSKTTGKEFNIKVLSRDQGIDGTSVILNVPSNLF